MRTRWCHVCVPHPFRPSETFGLRSEVQGGKNQSLLDGSKKKVGPTFVCCHINSRRRWQHDNSSICGSFESKKVRCSAVVGVFHEDDQSHRGLNCSLTSIRTFCARSKSSSRIGRSVSSRAAAEVGLCGTCCASTEHLRIRSSSKNIAEQGRMPEPRQ